MAAVSSAAIFKINGSSNNVTPSTIRKYLRFSTLTRYYFGCYLGSICLSLIFRIMAYFACSISKTNRVQHFEIIDQWWCPSIFREFLTRTLFELGWKQQKFGESVAMEIEKIINANEEYIILDLCSGCSGPSEIINNIINLKRSKNNKILTVLTDLYPETDSWNEICFRNQNIIYNKQSTDVTNIKLDNFEASIFKNKQIIRTLTSSFHHFQPTLCRKIFYDGFINNDIVIICDVWTDKSLKRFLFKFIFVVLLSGHISIFYIIRFWLFHSKLNIIKRIIKCIILIKLWPLFLFHWNHDSAISETRFYSVQQIASMAQEAAEKANKKYTFKNIPICTPKGLRAMNLFLCIPQKN